MSSRDGPECEAWRRVVKRVLGEQVYTVLQSLVNKELQSIELQPKEKKDD